MRFAYTRRGGPLLDWSGPTPPYPTRAGETRSLGAFYPTARNSGALRRYGGRSTRDAGAVGYEHNRALGAAYEGKVCVKVNGGMGDLNVPRPGAPEVVSGYEAPAPGAAVIHLGGWVPGGTAISFGADEPVPVFDTAWIRRASAVAAAYHGVRRNNGSVFWGLFWAAAAYVTPAYGVLVPAIGVAQGFGKPK